MSLTKKKLITKVLSGLFPYFVISLSAVLAFLPASSMLFAIKNDAIALDYPVKYFISQCLHNNAKPFWFNTWAMGFPVESIITWSFFSPLQFLWGGLFHYNLYTLHAEFIFYIVFSGCSMFYFLKRHISQNRYLNLILAICYMLSGFAAGSSQWLIYITAQALIPLVLTFYFSLLKTPSLKTSLLFVAAFYTMLTSAYLAFTIILVYVLFCIAVFFFVRKQLHDKLFFSESNILKYLLLTGILLTIFCTPALFYTLQVLQNIVRGKPMIANTSFFNSNFIPPQGFLSLLVPLSAPKIQAINTEGTMTDLYLGLLPLLLLPLSIFKNIKEKNWPNYIPFLVAFFFLILSTGPLTPLRNSLNILPGFSYFRNPGLFRLFFILFMLIYLSVTFSNFKSFYHQFKKTILLITSLTAFILGIIFILLAFFYYQTFNFNFQNFDANNLKKIIDESTNRNLIFASACIQLSLLILASLFYKLRAFRLLLSVFALDLVINCLLCTPFFTVSSYSVKKINDELLKSTPGFPIQKLSPSVVPTSVHIGKATWYNTNVYQKNVSSLDSYFGPLVLKNFQPDSFGKHNTLILFSKSPATTVRIIKQNPDYVSAQIQADDSPNYIFFQQNFYDGWKAYFNHKPIPITSENSIMKIRVSGSGFLEFKYERNILFTLTILINSMIIGIVIFYIIAKTKSLFTYGKIGS